jgi:1-acyl-sn-glycerol-3-phosphate acyltransferase
VDHPPALPHLAQADKEQLVQAWAREMLGLMRIELHVSGQPPARGPILLVANHISWLDILVLHAAGYCRFVSKADIKRWPVVGTLATAAGTCTSNVNRAATPCAWCTT